VLTGIVGTIAKVVGLHATRRYGWPEFAGRMLERSMELVTIEEGAVVSVAVKGRLDSVGAELLKSRLSQLIESGTTRLVIDFSQVAYVSSAGFRVLLVSSRLAEQAKGALALSSISGEVRRLFDLSALTEMFTILPDRAQAVEALANRGG
jgi:anti-anti-sigma factor